MNPKRNSIAAWSFSTWFAFLSPVIGVLLGLFGAFLLSSLKGGAKMKTTSPQTRSNASEISEWFRRSRRQHDPMLVFNMSIFNSAKVRECIFNSLPQRENVWL